MEVDAALARDLLAEQHPDLAELPLELVNRGWDNAIFRLGEGLAVRMPLREIGASLITNEQRWLPVLASRLPVSVPAPIRIGAPGAGYPWPWSIVPWLPGAPPVELAEAEQLTLADDLADLLIALHRAAPDDAPDNPFRGGPLVERDAVTLERLGRCSSRLEVDPAAVERVWAEAVAVAPWSGPPIWIHGDLHSLNVLGANGRLTAIIDFGDVTGGDPATDLMAAWYLFDTEARTRLRSRLFAEGHALDDRVWARGRGWGVTHALAVLDSELSAPTLNDCAHRTLSRLV